MKFAMVPINTKENDNGDLMIRRVLIKYVFKKTKTILGLLGHKYKKISYYGTKIIAKDDYFNREDASHKYIFEDNYYRLIEVTDEETKLTYSLKEDIYKRRKYHYNNYMDLPKAIEFKADSIEEAIEKFQGREELR